VILYAESSAVLAWLLGEPSQRRVIDALAAADQVVTSSLTAVECARGLARARAERRITKVEEEAALHLLDEATAAWHSLELSEDVMRGARESFPREPVRTLDALHLASAALVQSAGVAVSMLSLDDRVRDNAAALGLELLPDR